MREGITLDCGSGTVDVRRDPIVIDGILHTATPSLQLVALNAATGRGLWRYNPFGEGEEGGVVNRGVVYWADKDGWIGRLFYGVEERLLAIDAKTGKAVSGFGEGDRILLGFGSHEKGREMSAPGAPAIYQDHVIIG